MTAISIAKSLVCIAHRGGSQRFTENTLAAFEEALHLGVDAIELDVWNISGELLVTHDRRLGKSLPGHGLLLEQSPAELRQLLLPCGNRLATLAEVLELVGDQAMLNIELKGPDCVEPVARLLEEFVQRRGLGWDHYLISSFDHPQLLACKQRLPQVKRGVLISHQPLDYAASFAALEPYSLNPCIDFINAELVHDAQARGLKVWVYTVNDEEDMQQMAALGVDGVFTDYPARLQALNARSRQT